MFKKTNQDGTPKQCKFCHQNVWWHVIEGRWYDIGGEKLHVDSCPLRAEHFRHKALDRAESRRKQK